MSGRSNGCGLSLDLLGRASRALGHPHRLTIVGGLVGRGVARCSGERANRCAPSPASCNVGEPATLAGIAPSTLTQHLEPLPGSWVIERSRRGRFLYGRVGEALLDELAAMLWGGVAERREGAACP